MEINDKVVVSLPNIKPFFGVVTVIGSDGIIFVQDMAGKVHATLLKDLEVFVSKSMAKRVATQRGG